MPSESAPSSVSPLREGSSTPRAQHLTVSVESPPDELSPLLTRSSTRRQFYNNSSHVSPVTPRSINEYRGTGHVRNHHRIKSLRRALSVALTDHPLSFRKTAATPAEDLRVPEDESAYDQFTSIDWVQDTIAGSLRSRRLRGRPHFLGQLPLWWDDAQGWILAALVGVLVAAIAYLVDISESYLFDLKLGYCQGKLFASELSCCSDRDSCDEWVLWNSLLSKIRVPDVTLGYLIYIVFMLAMALMACVLVLSFKRVAPSKLASKTEKDLDPAQIDHFEKAQSSGKGKVLYPVSGSGVAEVKVIASGFVIHGFLGVKTLFLKAIGCTLSVASGLSVGKEGPYVHIAACIGNIVSRLSPKYYANAAKRREIISAASAAGVAVAFGAPISGVLFSLEEVSYYFPAKTLFRTFFCSIVAAVTLRFLDPYGTSKIVLFQVEYHRDWRALEMIMFVFLGSLGGALGAFFIKASRLWARSFRKLPLIRSSFIFEVGLVAIVSGAVSYWNKYTRLPVAGLMLELASDCRRWEETGTGLCPTAHEIPDLLVTLAAAFLVKAVLSLIAYGIKVPAGIYMPSMVCGGLLGRFLGHAVQYLLVTYTSMKCSAHGRLESCVVPGVYALIGAGSVMVGVTRLSITVAVMLFELSGSLDHVLPFSIAVMSAKWVADAVEPLSIYVTLTPSRCLPACD